MNDKVLEAHIIIHSDLSDPNSYAKASPSLKKRVHTLVKDFPSLRVDTLTPIEPLYKCIFPECDVMVGGKREAARTHVESHHWPRLGNAPFPPDVKVACPACPMDSKNGVRKPKEMQIQNLGRHMADKHFCSSLLKCKVCDKQVARADRFPKHFRLCYSSRVDRLSGEGPPLKRARII
ncbi:hypothetical protein B0H10DRAFT_1210617 [Mycena sp. CBHHK59/15]|nr:hypothetical protein B0H10DRAFT_1210617 [Mycena sp. CBHHK59/15]